MMRVIVKLFATLREGRFGVEALDLEPGATVANIVRRLDILEKEAALIFRNGRHADLSTELADGDILSIFPPIRRGLAWEICASTC
jgi:sulfur carrier protein